MNHRAAVLWALSQVSGLSWNSLGPWCCYSQEVTDSNFFIRHGVPPKYARKASHALHSFDRDRACEALNRARARVLTIMDDDYPELLRSIYDPPLVLFVRGALPWELPCAGVVGSRKHSTYGRQAVEAIIPPLVAGGVVVVSGLARGIDTQAHRITLRHGGTTVAVLGSGIDHIYPHENRTLAETIVAEGGAVISEYPPGTPPQKHFFPARNRIISGLCKAVIIIEGDRKSGSLITAEHAMEQGRDVLAVPGSIFSDQSRGPNWLISQGATPLIDPGVALESMGITLRSTSTLSKSSSVTDLAPSGMLLLDCLNEEPRDVDYLVNISKLSVGEVLAQLTELEMVQLVERLPGGKYLALSRK